MGAVEYAQIIKTGLIKGAANEPIAQNSELGWIISGPVNANQNRNINVAALVSNVEIDNKLNQIFSTDDVQDLQIMPLSDEEEYCENHFVTTHKRDHNGKYIVKIPFKNGLEFPDLGDSRKCAIATFLSLERKFDSNPSLAEEYKKFIHEYIDLGHMEEFRYNPTDLTFFMPHHHVLKDSTTTKLRVVFNASQRSRNGRSLNEQMAIGALQQNDILNILLRFRTFEFAFTADVEKMYRQILIDDDQTNLQCIVWRDSTNEPIRSYRLKTVTYGTANAPYLAIRAIRQLAFDTANEYPEISDVILSCMYVDDVLAGAATRADVIRIYEQLKTVFGSAGFNLRKWSTNCTELSNIIPEQDLELKAFSSNIKALGIAWSPITDNFTFEVKLSEMPNSFTKRVLLSEIASIFDPAGWLGPVVIASKHLIQLLWKENLDWDDDAPQSILEKWLQIRNEIALLNTIQIPRWIGYSPGKKYELHGFCDASEIAYTASLYVKSVEENKVFLLTAKCRVAPLKHSKDQLTIPRLELCGAALLAKLTKKTVNALCIQFDKIYLWCDSKIVICWIKGNPKRFKTFVANKVCAINKCVASENWFHVSSENNPADYASRGQTPSQLINNTVWWNGPDFLYRGQYPITCNDTENSLTFDTMIFNASTQSQQSQITIQKSILPDVSDFYKMQRVIATCLRWKTKNTGAITYDELKKAEIVIVKIVQREAFPSELYSLQQTNTVHRSSNVVNLSPFLDDNGIIRVGGRLANATIPYRAKHPALMPKNHAVSKLIILLAHLRCNHGGVRCTEAVVRYQYWILNSQSQVKSVLKKCIDCFHQKKDTMSQIMAHLPANRVSIVDKPFTNVAVDYTGAINYKMSKGRGGKIAKAYICIFVCMSIKAVHVELVSDMTAEAFIAAFRRLVARRGMVKNFYSDNGTNFVKANRDLFQLSEAQAEEFANSINGELTKQGTTWHFSPAGGPHFNGLAEAAVRVIKTHLIKTIGKTTLTFEELCTLLYQIEACANSRPLCPLSTDPNDLECLTPGHFLIGAPLLSAPDENCLEINANWLSRWQLVQKMTQRMWKSFQNEYLHHLQTKSKWFTQNEEPKQNDLVLVKKKTLHLVIGQWPECWKRILAMII
ncbi:MAG: hypothetical protein EOP45_02210 [Sphingobacteriaceae bacterium]|nr:MAG: hypothetical protein EOP45_02210 [Sphingobacteriaceae bacterium]